MNVDGPYGLPLKVGRKEGGRGRSGGEGGGRRTPLLLALKEFDHSKPLNAHPLRDGGPIPNNLIETPTTFGRSLRFFRVLHKTVCSSCPRPISPSERAVGGEGGGTGGRRYCCASVVE